MPPPRRFLPAAKTEFTERTIHNWLGIYCPERYDKFAVQLSINVLEKFNEEDPHRYVPDTFHARFGMGSFDNRLPLQVR
jgi:hypothetical protein